MSFRDVSEKERYPFCKSPSYVFLQQRLLPFLVETPGLVRPSPPLKTCIAEHQTLQMEIGGLFWNHTDTYVQSCFEHVS